MIKRYLVLLALGLLLIAGCCNNTTPVDPELGVISLNKDITLSTNECSERQLNDKIVFIGSKYCGACKAAKPRLKELEVEKKVDIVYLDISEEADRNAMLMDYHVSVYYTPTILFGCNVIVGAREKSDYSQLIDEFLK